MFLFFLNSSAEAHRISPAITSLFSQPDSLRAEISINLEALVAGIGPEHEDTDDAPASEEYNRLRAMPAPELEQVFQGFASEFMKQVEIRLDEQPLEAKLKELIIPESGDLELARSSRVILEFPVSTNSQNLDWRMSEIFGDHVLRLMDSKGEVVNTWWVKSGERSLPVSLEGLPQRDFMSRFLEYVEIGFTHILPKGLDHILFVLGLFLLSAHWKPLLVQVTSFTVAHT
ncbi:MAG: HupE/UreJ family protein, partial [SAR324 cluster bacterium]|nr:HupE/UreJ family protein [SAR324 cluster bacterium]